MTVIACVEAVGVLVVVFLMLRYQRALEDAWTVERRELLTRIQRPELVPVPHRERVQLPEPDVDELEMVGVIQDFKEDEE